LQEEAVAQAKTHPIAGVAEIDFNAEDFLLNYKKVYMDLHASGCPFAHSSDGDFYAVAGHKDIVEACVRADQWSSKFGPGLAYQPPETPGVLVSVDPPEHTFEARLVGKAFSKTYFDSFIPGIRAFVNEKIDAVFADGRCDLHATLSEPLPLWVIFKMFGRDTDPAEMQAFREGLLHGVGQMLRPGNSTTPQNPTTHFLAGHLAETKRRLAAGEADPEENLLTRFISSEIGGRRLTDEKILGFCSFLLTAGSATTTILLSNLVHRLLSDPEQFARLKADRGLIPLAIEECLRVDAPVHGLFRTNNTPTRMGPLELEADTKVMMLWAAGSLDPTVFPDPTRFDLDRDIEDVRKHLAFGYGIHICRGAPLSRIEAQLFLEAVLDRLPGLRLDGEIVPELRAPVLQGIRKLPVAWDVAG
jgi:cytochrome P450